MKTDQVNGLHHLAICTTDIKQQIEYFSDVLGMKLVALYWMHGVEGAWHGFLKLNDRCSIAFVQTPQIKDIPVEIGKTHAGNPGAPCAPGTMQHLALNVDSVEQLLQMRDRIRGHGVPVMGPIDHGFCQSIYFAGPENLALELSTSAEAINPAAWIDPEVQALAGIDALELARYLNPPEHVTTEQAVQQPSLSGPGPHMSNYRDGVYETIMNMPDDELFARMSETQPPVVAG